MSDKCVQWEPSEALAGGWETCRKCRRPKDEHPVAAGEERERNAELEKALRAAHERLAKFGYKGAKQVSRAMQQIEAVLPDLTPPWLDPDDTAIYRALRWLNENGHQTAITAMLWRWRATSEDRTRLKMALRDRDKELEEALDVIEELRSKLPHGPNDEVEDALLRKHGRDVS